MISGMAETVKTGLRIVLSRVRLKWDVLCRAHRYGYIPNPSELVARGEVLLDEETECTSRSVTTKREKLHTKCKGKDEVNKETIVTPVLSLSKTKGDELDETNNDLPVDNKGQSFQFKKQSVTDQSGNFLKRPRTESGSDEEALSSEGSKKQKGPDNNALQQENPRSGTEFEDAGKAVSVEQNARDQTFFKNNEKLVIESNFQGSDETKNEVFNLESQRNHLDVIPLTTDSDKASKDAQETNAAEEEMVEVTNIDKLEACLKKIAVRKFRRKRKKIHYLKREVETLQRKKQKLNEETRIMQSKIDDLTKDFGRKSNHCTQVNMDVVPNSSKGGEAFNVETSAFGSTIQATSKADHKEKSKQTFSKILNRTVAEVLSEAFKFGPQHFYRRKPYELPLTRDHIPDTKLLVSTSKKDSSVPTSFDDSSLCPPHRGSCQDSKLTSPQTANSHQTAPTTTFSYRPAELSRNQSQKTSAWTPATQRPTLTISSTATPPVQTPATQRPTLTISSTATPPVQADQVAFSATRTINATNNVLTPAFHQALPKISSNFSLTSFKTNKESPGRISSSEEELFESSENVQGSSSFSKRDSSVSTSFDDSSLCSPHRGSCQDSKLTSPRTANSHQTLTTTTFSYRPAEFLRNQSQKTRALTPVTHTVRPTLTISSTTTPPVQADQVASTATRTISATNNVLTPSFHQALTKRSSSFSLASVNTNKESPGGISVSSCTSTVSSCGSTVSSCTSTVSSCASTVSSCASTVSSCTSTVSSCASTVSSCTSTVSSCASTVNSCAPTVRSCVSAVSSCASTVSSCASTVSSCASTVSSCVSTVSSCTSTVSSCTSTVSKDGIFSGAVSNASFRVSYTSRENFLNRSNPSDPTAMKCLAKKPPVTTESRSFSNLPFIAVSTYQQGITGYPVSCMSELLNTLPILAPPSITTPSDGSKFPKTQLKSDSSNVFNCVDKSLSSACSISGGLRITQTASNVSNTVQTDNAITNVSANCQSNCSVKIKTEKAQQKSTADNASASCQHNINTCKTFSGGLTTDNCSDNENVRVKTTVNSVEAPRRSTVKFIPKTVYTFASSAVDRFKGSSADRIDNANQMPLQVKTSSCSNNNTFEASLTNVKSSALSSTCSVPPFSVSSDFNIGTPSQVKSNEEITTCSVKTPKITPKIAPNVIDIKPVLSPLALESKTGKMPLSSLKEAKIQTSIPMFTCVAQTVVNVSNVALSTNKGCVSSSTTVSSGKTNYSPLPVLGCTPPLPPKPVACASVVKENIVLSWRLSGGSSTSIDNYEVYSYIAEDLPHLNGANPWRKISSLKSTKAQMSCVLTEFKHGLSYYFTVRAVDIYGRGGPTSLPCMVKAEKGLALT